MDAPTRTEERPMVRRLSDMGSSGTAATCMPRCPHPQGLRCRRSVPGTRAQDALARQRGLVSRARCGRPCTDSDSVVAAEADIFSGYPSAARRTMMSPGWTHRCARPCRRAAHGSARVRRRGKRVAGRVRNSARDSPRAARQQNKRAAALAPPNFLTPRRFDMEFRPFFACHPPSWWRSGVARIIGGVRDAEDGPHEYSPRESATCSARTGWSSAPLLTAPLRLRVVA